MTTSILPTAAEKALAQLDVANSNFQRSAQLHQTLTNRILTQSVSDDGTTKLTLADIQAAAPTRLAALPAFLAARDAMLAFTPAATTTASATSSAAASTTATTSAA